MGMRGPAPTPKEILKARGSWRAGVGGPPPDLGAGAPAPPPWLDDEARAEWARVVPALLGAAVVAPADGGLLAAYCSAWSDLVRVSAQLAATLKRRPAKGPSAGQLTYQKIALAKLLVALAAQFGLSPSARARVQAVA